MGTFSSNDAVAIAYDFEMENGSWNVDLIPFFSIGNGDYFCLSARAGRASPVFYVYHEDGRVEEYSQSFEEWLRGLPNFLNG